MRRWLAVVLLVLVLVLVPGGVLVVAAVAALSESQRKVRRELRAAADRYGLDPDVLDALGFWETRPRGWKLGAVNKSGPDGERGGAYGPTQITEKTARAHGFDGSMDTLGNDAWLSAEWTARILAARPGGPPLTPEDAAAWWNAGRTSAAKLPADHVTRTDYIPGLLAAVAKVRAEPVS